MKWKMFLRTNGRWSLAHLCNENNECMCGWKYDASEFTKIKESEDKPHFACRDCENNLLKEFTPTTELNAGLAKEPARRKNQSSKAWEQDLERLYTTRNQQGNDRK